MRTALNDNFKEKINYPTYDNFSISNSDNKLRIESFNDTIILIKELFIKQGKLGKSLFSDTQPNPDLFIELITELQKGNNINLPLEEIYDLFNNKFLTLEIDNIPYNLENYLKQFIDTYKVIPEPMYIKNYINWASVFIEDKSTSNIIAFITFIHRFSLFILILRSISIIIEYSFTPLHI